MAGLSTLHNRRLQDIAILMYKVKNDMCPTYISNLFGQPAIKYELRNHEWLHYTQIQHSLLWKALAQVYGPKGMEFCSK